MRNCALDEEEQGPFFASKHRVVWVVVVVITMTMKPWIAVFRSLEVISIFCKENLLRRRFFLSIFERVLRSNHPAPPAPSLGKHRAQWLKVCWSSKENCSETVSLLLFAKAKAKPAAGVWRGGGVQTQPFFFFSRKNTHITRGTLYPNRVSINKTRQHALSSPYPFPMV